MSDRRVYSLQSRGSLLTLQAALGSSESGSKVVRLLIDTGSNFTTLPVNLLDEIGCDLTNLIRRVITTANGIFHCLSNIRCSQRLDSRLSCLNVEIYFSASARFHIQEGLRLSLIA